MQLRKNSSKIAFLHQAAILSVPVLQSAELAHNMSHTSNQASLMNIHTLFLKLYKNYVKNYKILI